jgi:hypothetical protein
MANNTDCQKKMLVAPIFVHLCQTVSPRKPTIIEVAQLTKVGKTYAGKESDKIQYKGGLQMPKNPPTLMLVIGMLA